ncbi:hypothetical protein D9619_007969 [Psilocybe cf. subviscida]|uniref:Uncharacterized protein n=1 Tax=Psilocybe cf. subviscida TaxID=2480587 RepID=A0A8H5AU59_9AGAR|nr:hypothetical protein D9619_007969 [Psilocybe cf. subviscida]
MPSVDGVIACTTGSHFAAYFIIDKITFRFSGIFSSTVLAFTSETTTLNYPSLKSLSSTMSFEGRVGPSKVFLNLSNGVTIKGVLDMPLIISGNVTGGGTWTQVTSSVQE